MGGDYAAGATGDDDNGDRNGSVYVFTTTNNGAKMDTNQKLNAGDAGHNNSSVDNFGSAAVINGNHLVVGAMNDLSNNVCSGSVYIFTTSNNGGMLDYKHNILYLTTRIYMQVGSSVAISNNYIIVGAYMYNAPVGHSNRETGSVYIYYK